MALVAMEEARGVLEGGCSFDRDLEKGMIEWKGVNLKKKGTHVKTSAKMIYSMKMGKMGKIQHGNMPDQGEMGSSSN